MVLDSLATARARQLSDLVARYDGRAPRYTSYPTAVQFGPEVDEAVYRRWLAELPADDPVSLYVHVPFCARLCWYCGCNTRAVNRHEPIGEYVQLLLTEMGLLGQAIGRRLPARAVHLGGGTPNMLSPDDMAALFGRLGEVFDLAPELEVAAELDPSTLSRDWVDAAARHGLNRASLGVQNLDATVQTAVNRRETFEQVAAAVGWLRDARVRSINLDLMYGLPHQTKTNTLTTVEAVLRLAPERIALFGYAHVPWMKAHQQLIDEQALPSPAARLDQAEAAAERLVAEGYVRIGLDHFARADDEMAAALAAGRLHRNFQGYTTDAASTLLGLGASAIGRLPQGYVQNVTQELGWRVAVHTDQLPVARGVALTADDRFRGEIIERLMCDLAVDLADVCVRHDRDPRELSEAMGRLAPFVADGLVAIDGGHVEVLGPGRLVVRSICACFDAYFAPDATRHSRAL
ncbi:oxygen-independent coproporphyrinogen III oxidase [Phenylobacterium sp.]|uniref:oxygen-independent coproporphyrinogen III oxidase n=1 Tax=Phenylobacterium sp. TaxID=1871053 RepID=UPI0026009DA1|nr:oxygen-independent coproporphyrinogen III oxidase [Phenylobacterium sp.]MBX3485460.1 oxygen-independent coproporphyrinogen III oxidase [Phenylobacterium sp.]MCW5758961.1 oxygen-independent coproporphyrinogen III oxidase [Phenylobacterium sp.]